MPGVARTNESATYWRTESKPRISETELSPVSRDTNGELKTISGANGSTIIATSSRFQPSSQ